MGTEWYGGRQEKKHGEQQKADTLRTYPYLSVLLRTSPYFSDIAATFREHRKKNPFFIENALEKVDYANYLITRMII